MYKRCSPDAKLCGPFGKHTADCIKCGHNKNKSADEYLEELCREFTRNRYHTIRGKCYDRMRQEIIKFENELFGRTNRIGDESCPLSR